MPIDPEIEQSTRQMLTHAIKQEPIPFTLRASPVPDATRITNVSAIPGLQRTRPPGRRIEAPMLTVMPQNAA